jgi:hypothetical protein
MVLPRPEAMHSNISHPGISKPFMQHSSLVMSTRRRVLRRRGQLGSHPRRALSTLKPVSRRFRLHTIRALTTANLLFQLRPPRGELFHPFAGLFGPPASLIAALAKPAIAVSGHGGSLRPARAHPELLILDQPRQTVPLLEPKPEELRERQHISSVDRPMPLLMARSMSLGYDSLNAWIVYKRRQNQDLVGPLLADRRERSLTADGARSPMPSRPLGP